MYIPVNTLLPCVRRELLIILVAMKTRGERQDVPPSPARTGYGSKGGGHNLMHRYTVHPKGTRCSSCLSGRSAYYYSISNTMVILSLSDFGVFVVCPLRDIARSKRRHLSVVRFRGFEPLRVCKPICFCSFFFCRRRQRPPLLTKGKTGGGGGVGHELSSAEIKSLRTSLLQHA